MPFTLEIAVVLAVLAGTLVLFVREVFSPDMVALFALATLLVTGVTDPATALAGFANPAVHTIAAMFVLSAGLLRTGVVDAIGRGLLRVTDSRPRRIFLFTLLPVAALSAFVNNTPLVVMMIPVMLRISAAGGQPASRLLIPLSYASILGGCCTLVGTSTNLVVSGLAHRAGLEPLGMFEMTPLGLVLLATGFLYLATIGRRLLPERNPLVSAPGREKLREYVTELLLGPRCALLGVPLRDTAIGKSGLKILELVRGEEILWPPLEEIVLREGDILFVRGSAADIVDIGRRTGVDLVPDLREGTVAAAERELALVELVVTPGSRFLGATVAEVGFARHFRLAVLAVQRHGHHIRGLGNLRLRVGDVVLVQGDVRSIEQMRGEDGFLLLESVGESLVRPHRAPLAVAIVASVIIAAAISPLPVVACAIGGAALMVLTGCLTVRQVYEGLDARTLVLVAGMIGFGLAAEKTGAIEWVARWTLPLVRPLGPHGILAAVYLLTMLLTEFLSNAASAVLVFPLAMSLAAEAGVSPRPFALAVAFAASASFATPIGYQTNTIVHGAGGYRFTDFVRVGLPLNILLAALTITLAPVFWPF